jgi:hypothetical protein
MTAARSSVPATLADLLALGDDARAELIDGQLVLRNAASPPTNEHGYAQASLTSVLFSRFSHRGGSGEWSNPPFLFPTP